jgi:hypothetical protein
VHGVWYGGYTSPPAMAATAPDPFSDLNQTIANLKILVELAELQQFCSFVELLRMQAPQEPQAIAPAAPVTSKMPGSIVETIADLKILVEMAESQLQDLRMQTAR